VRQPGQTEIGAQPVEQRQWHRLPILSHINQTIGQFVPDQGEFRGREMLRKFPWLCRCRVGGVKDIGEGDLLRRACDFDLDFVILGQRQRCSARYPAKRCGLVTVVA
jgi:hypothetical protein